MPLFDKFAPDRDRRGHPDDLERIMENLSNVLNTTREYGSFLKDFGIRPLNEYLSRGDIAVAVMQDVKEAIERYEPRLMLHEISLEDGKSPFRLSFVVRCAVRDDKRMLNVSFDTVFGKFDVANRARA